MRRLEGKVAIITGGSGGQGAVEARLFAQEGAAVAICDITNSPGEQVVRDIEVEGGQARYFHLDVSQEADWKDVVEKVLAWKGCLAILVNNAAILNRTGIIGTDLDSWNRVLGVNLTGTFLGIRAAAPAMRDSGGGAIVNIASVAAHVGHNDPAYSATKAGLLGLTRTAAMEFVDWGIRVNIVSPGIIITGLNTGSAHLEPWRRATALGRYGTSEEVAKAVLFLVSDDSSFITGEELVVDGGLRGGGTARRIALESGVNLTAPLT